MNILENVGLAQYTTFKIGGPARFFCIVKDEDELVSAIAFAKKQSLRTMVLGGGSNILISDAGFPGLVIKNEISGKNLDKTPQMGGGVVLSVGAGEWWDDIVEYTVSENLFGLENLSSIPGTVGAAPVQNIGAYGTEVSSCVVSVRAYDIKRCKFIELRNDKCKFSYRDSLFKQRKGRYIITRVSFRLDPEGKVNTSYRDLVEYFKAKGVTKPSLRDVRSAVVDIRSKKLPDWKLWGTAGSFFKNPVLSKRKFAKVKKAYPDLPGYQEPDGRVKIPLGWVLDNVCHVKGVMGDNVGTYQNQALVLVTKPGATATQVVNHAKTLMDMVEKSTGIKVEAEVEWVN